MTTSELLNTIRDALNKLHFAESPVTFGSFGVPDSVRHRSYSVKIAEFTPRYTADEADVDIAVEVSVAYHLEQVRQTKAYHEQLVPDVDRICDALAGIEAFGGEMTGEVAEDDDVRYLVSNVTPRFNVCRQRE